MALKLLGQCYETSLSSISATSSRRRRVAGCIASCRGGDLSVASGHNGGPFPAGGPTDTLARILADRMTAALGQSVVIEDVSGASGRVGLERVVRALPDGYTLSIGHWVTHVVIGATMKLPFDILNDFEPVALLADTPIWLVARRDLPPKDLTELIAWLKQIPGKALVGAVGVGGPSDLNETYFE